MHQELVPVELLGWTNIGGRTWRLPTGAYFTFPEGVDQVARRGRF